MSSLVRPLDPRLLKASAPARRWIMVNAAVTIALAALTVTMAILLAKIIAGVVLGGVRTVDALLPQLLGLAVTFAVRAALVAGQSWLGDRAATAVTHDLRLNALTALTAAPHPGDARVPEKVPTVAVADGLDAMGTYVARFLPTFVASMVITPALVLVTLYYDPISAAIEFGTIPLIPVFMALVGWATQSAAANRLVVAQKLSDQLLDLLAGLPTLRYARRAPEQQHQVLATAQRFRKATAAVLRQAFMSSLVLEVLTTLAVALVAVSIGVRLINGSMELEAGLTVLILAPEVFLPLRLVGQHFHASADGVAASTAALDVTELPQRPTATQKVDPIQEITWDDVSVAQYGRDQLAPAHFSAHAAAGQITALVGPTGCGKSTTIAATLGFIAATSGQIRVTTAQGTFDVAQLDRGALHNQVAWLPQQPSITVGDVTDNLWLPEDHQLTPSVRAVIAAESGLDVVLATLPDGWQTQLGRGGFGLSAGQRHRVALARALARVHAGARVLIVDEPTAHLDADTERLIATTLRRCANQGAIVVVVAHRPALVTAADVVWQVERTAIST